MSATLSDVRAVHVNAKARMQSAEDDYKRVVAEAEERYRRTLDEASATRDAVRARIGIEVIAQLEELGLDAEPAETTSRRPDPTCPKCGAGIEFSCHGDEGPAHCERSAKATMVHGTLVGSGQCEWSGRVRRVEGGGFEIVEAAPVAQEPEPEPAPTVTPVKRKPPTKAPPVIQPPVADDLF